MKTFNEQNYNTTIKVSINFGSFTHIDEIKGLNKGHALHLARLNWPTSQSITIIN